MRLPFRRPPPADAEAATPFDRALEDVGRRYAYHAAGHGFWRRTAAVLAAGQALTALALVLHLSLTETRYVTVAATADGRVIPVTAMSEPVMAPAALNQWTVAAVTEALTLGHHDWRARLEAVRDRFTADGYTSFLGMLSQSKLLPRLRDNLQVANAVARGAPVITWTHLFDGGARAGWGIEFPLLLTFHAGAARVDEELLAKVLVVRVPRVERTAGVAIQQLVLSRGRPSG